MTALGAFFLGLIAMAALSLPFCFQFRRTIKTKTDETAKLAQQVIQLQEVLAGMPDGLYRWNLHSRVENCSARMAVLLGLEKGKHSKFPEILNCFDAEAARTLEAAVQTLHRQGQSFDLILPMKDGNNRVVQAIGQRVLNEEGDALVDLLWMRPANEAAIAHGPMAKALQNISQEREKLLSVLESLPIAIWMRDSAGHIQFQNPVAPETDCSFELAQRALETGRPAKAKMSLASASHHGLFDVTEIPLPQGEGVLGLAQDISQSEDRIQRAERSGTMLRTALENLVTAIAIFDENTRLTFYNGAYARLWGLSSDWLETKPGFGEILDRLRETRRLPEYANFRIFRQDQLARFKDLKYAEEETLHLPDNVTLRAITSPHPNGGLVKTYEDVTDTLALESSNKALSAVQRETLDNLFEGVVVFGANGRVRLFNPAFCEIWKLEESFMASHPHITAVLEECRDFYDGVEDWPAFRDQLVSKIMMRQPNSQRLRRADGLTLEYASVPLPDGSSLLSYLNVTDSALVEEADRERSTALIEADRLKSEFIANVSYEIRTPLTTLIGFADLLSEEYFGALNKRQMEYARGIHDCGTQLNTVLSDILDLATIEAAQLELERAPFDLHAMLVSVLTLIKESARFKRIKLSFDCDKDIGLMDGDEKRLKQVMFNLLSNAVRHTPLDGTIRLSCKPEEDQIVIQIFNSGSTLSPEEQTHIFSSFYKGSDGMDAEKGAGLGLTLVKRFIDMHHGHIEVTSDPKSGTTFTCRLPL